jgi:hypothetical protein
MSLLKFLWKRNRDRGQEVAPDVRDLAARLEQVSEQQPYPVAAAGRARERMLRALAGTRTAAPAARPGAIAGFASRRRIAFAAALAAVMLLLTAGGLTLMDGGRVPLSSPSAEAVLIQGTLDSQTASGLTLITESGSQVVVIDDGAQVIDAVGNPIALDALLKGQALSVRGRRDEHSGVVVSEIKAVTEIHGTVVSFSPTLLRLTSRRGDYDLIVTPETRIEGLVRPGVPVEVEIERGVSGELIAKEIEAEDEHEDEEEDHGSRQALPAVPAGVPSPPSTAVEVSLSQQGTEAPITQPPPAVPGPDLSASPTAKPSSYSGHDNSADDDDGETEIPGMSGPDPQPTPSGSSSHEDDDHHDDEEECDADEDDDERDDEDDPCVDS